MNIALITARGGSKGLPRKNIIDLNGLPLIAWSINAGLASKYVDKVFVTTEDEEIAEVSKKFGAEIIPRPMELAEDTTASEPVFAHAIEYLKEQGIEVDKVCVLQPTSPLRTTEDIDNAFELYEKKNAKCILSVFEPKHTAAKAYKVLDDGSITGLLFDSAPYTRRQDLPVTYNPNGAVYLFSASDFMEEQLIPRTEVYPLVMCESRSADIDTIHDLIEVQKVLSEM
ncbi:acylneuraminate cytidylyltransferase family protein [Photobacterium damselae subsp. piscicida]|uniref:Acylneuraminate cytidylyltransferase family protein n=1 Tax=Photobacterium damsela subsp. piscicida TaxID=38294 RepID=A0A1Q9GVQ4_PHODP|nr:acylneuraminate cytidylyltransferase family protein [Photobacterium damselae]MBE8127291.1 acylneuraminate cytidylyltransferase family protein [Photobacterium damselae subsp. piscicida]MDP2515310.1 acylneuraminate cytidylyltransferase family protein [Photobacterium damselae subsp. piscicida]MDP2531362.1 acylneuraminate cytidylyltransferase family protein [Photobacterium damselae subsp. piscicida]MDP2543749.1 acylneuraminate cytidylyltransferase family protein [Photobacterium damselae subsp. p